MNIKINQNYSETTSGKNELKQHVVDSLTSYLSSRSYSSDIINEIVSENFIASNPIYYLFYPYLFNQYFEFHDKDVLDLLSISGFLYYRSVILIDDIFDNKSSKDNFQKFFIANICQEETIKILSHFFNKDSEFWHTWNMRKMEYAKAFKLDKTLVEIKDYSQYEELADYKSAFGKIAIDCLYYLSEEKESTVYKLLLNSHMLFYTGFQIMDDILDYEEDLENGQFNISRYELKKTLNKKIDFIEGYSVGDQKKLVYINGVAEKLYLKAINYINNSHSLLVDFNESIQDCYWKNEITCLHNTGIAHYLNIKGFIEVFEVEKRLSHDIKKATNSGIAIGLAIDYLARNQQENGSWNDIFNDAGISDVWTTSFLVYSLSRSKNILPKNILIKAKEFIAKSKSCNNIWGYNTAWVEDADSSSFALLSLKDSCTDDVSIKAWLDFQNQEGGFTTYNNKNVLLSSLNSPIIQNTQGWSQSHFCVSAVAYLVFVELHLSQKSNFIKIRSSIIDWLNSNEDSLSYWWADDIYAIYHILLGALLFEDKAIINCCNFKLRKSIDRECCNYFFEGLLLKTLCLTKNIFNEHQTRAEELARHIQENQYADGSWEAGYSLKIPHPSVININDKNIVWKEGNKGTNILVKDYNRLFTTVSCLTALEAYGERISQLHR